MTRVDGISREKRLYPLERVLEDSLVGADVSLLLSLAEREPSSGRKAGTEAQIYEENLSVSVDILV